MQSGFRRSVRGRRLVERDRRPVQFCGHDFVTERDCGRSWRGVIRRLVQNRAVEPDDVFDVVPDLGDVLALKNARLVRLEVAVYDGVAVIVFATRPVDVLRRQRRREGQKRRDEEQGNSTTHAYFSRDKVARVERINIKTG
jgi:hypothetical protein